MTCAFTVFRKSKFIIFADKYNVQVEKKETPCLEELCVRLSMLVAKSLTISLNLSLEILTKNFRRFDH
jgi:hypothetical protein